MASIKTNLARVRTLIAEVCRISARPCGDVTLVAVSKGHDFTLVEEAYQAGQRDFGESYAQEMIKKMDLAREKGMLDIVWHFIGTIQSNKLKLIMRADVIHSLCSLRQAFLLSQLAKKPMAVFLQVRLEQNPEKPGFIRSELSSIAKEVGHLPNIVLKGLMCMPPQTLTHPPRFWFASMKELREELLSQGLPELKLSMGMTDDFVDAIAMGADYVRIGTKIFGPRNYLL